MTSPRTFTNPQMTKVIIFSYIHCTPQVGYTPPSLEDCILWLADYILLLEDCILLLEDCIPLLEDCILLLEDCILSLEDCILLLGVNMGCCILGTWGCTPSSSRWWYTWGSSAGTVGLDMTW